MVAQQELAAAFLYHVKLVARHYFLDAGQRRTFDEQIIALRLAPKASEIGIVDEDVRSIRRVRSVFQICLSAV